MKRDKILERLRRITKRIEMGYIAEEIKYDIKATEDNIEDLLKELEEAWMSGVYKEES